MKPLHILVGCEESGEVRRALRARGHDAWSCDLLPAADGSRYHLQCDVRSVLTRGWDAMIAFPPCTYLTNAQARWLKDHWVTAKRAPGGRYWHDGSERRRLQAEALQFVLDLFYAPIRLKALENPRGFLSTLWMPPTQEIHPWQHGHPEEKITALWLDGLPPLVPSNIVPPPYDQRVWRMSPGPDRARLRGHTLPGIALAMATQWFPFVPRDDRGFCRFCGATVPPIEGEGTCQRCWP